jgi:hypothetical protein
MSLLPIGTLAWIVIWVKEQMDGSSYPPGKKEKNSDESQKAKN